MISRLRRRGKRRWLTVWNKRMEWVEEEELLDNVEQEGLKKRKWETTWNRRRRRRSRGRWNKKKETEGVGRRGGAGGTEIGGSRIKGGRGRGAGVGQRGKEEVEEAGSVRSFQSLYI